MPEGLRSRFRRALADRTALIAYLRERFPGDPNRSSFEALADFAFKILHVFPPNIVCDDRELHFVNAMKAAVLLDQLVEQSARRKIIEIGPDLDFLENLCQPERLSALQILCFAMRLRCSAQKRVAIVLMVRDEGIYLPEWLGHYNLLGADHIFVYANDNEDGSDLLLHELALNGSITLIKNVLAKGVNPQRKAYQHSILFLDELRDYEWVLFVDTDEFLNFPGENLGALPKFVRTVEERFHDSLPGAVVFPWNWRLTDRAFARPAFTVLEQYPHAAPHRLFKSLVNMRQTLAMCEVHVPTLDEDSFIVDGELRPIGRADVWNGVPKPYIGPVIEHFRSKSFLEFFVKKRRGDRLGLPGKEFLREFEQFFAWTGLPTQANFSPISQSWVWLVEETAAAYLAHPSVGAAYRAVAQRYRKQIETLSKDPAILATYSKLLRSVATTM